MVKLDFTLKEVTEKLSFEIEAIVEGKSGLPIEVDTSSKMDALLVANNVGKIYKYVGTTDATYKNGELYQVVDE